MPIATTKMTRHEAILARASDKSPMMTAAQTAALAQFSLSLGALHALEAGAGRRVPGFAAAK